MNCCTAFHRFRPSSESDSYVFPCTTLEAQFDGTGIHSLRGKKNGSARTLHPITGSTDRSSTRYLRTLSIKSFRDATPFFRSNASQARDAGSAEYRTKNPPPTMKLSGLWSLNRNGSPGCNTRNVLDPLGCQKLTSSGASRIRCSYQLL